MPRTQKHDRAISEAERRHWICMQHDIRITTTFVVCGTCGKKCEIKEELNWLEEAITDKEARARFERKGWTIKPTRCPKHAKKGRKHVQTSRR